MDISDFMTPARLAVIGSWYTVLINIELVVLLSFALGAAVKCAFLVRQRGTDRSSVLVRLSFFIVVLVCVSSALASAGRPVLTPGLVDPGTWLTRWLVVAISPWQRRLIEPALLMLLILTHVVSVKQESRPATVLFWTVFAASLLESGASSIAMQDLAYAMLSPAPFLLLHTALMQLLFGMLLLICRREFSSPSGAPKPNATASSVAVRRFTGVVLLGAVFVAGVTLGESICANRRPPLAGAHYYSWFPENWVGGYAAGSYEPPIVPLLGEYSSADRSVFKQHVQWAKQAGLRYFIFDWWPRRKEIRRRVKDHAEMLSGEPDFNFAIHYETLDLKEPKDEVPADEAGNVVIMTPLRAERLKKHWEWLARSYMSEPAYLRIDRRPVLFLYATRHLVGPVRQAVEDARRHVYRETGMRLFLVADEAFYNVLDFEPGSGVRLLPQMKPHWERLSAFDAVTCYNPYDPQRPAHGAGDEGKESFIDDVGTFYRRYYSVASTLGIPFIPAIIPGYDDRGVRPAEGHYPLTRSGAAGWKGALLEHSLEQLVVPFAPEGRPFFAVTSWNEWNEGTQIEPATATGNRASRRPLSPVSFDGYLSEHLFQLKSFMDRYRLIEKQR